MSPPVTHDVTNHAPVQWKVGVFRGVISCDTRIFRAVLLSQYEECD